MGQHTAHLPVISNSFDIVQFMRLLDDRVNPFPMFTYIKIPRERSGILKIAGVFRVVEYPVNVEVEQFDVRIGWRERG
jgi:hypothetical protein